MLTCLYEEGRDVMSKFCGFTSQCCHLGECGSVEADVWLCVCVCTQYLGSTLVKDLQGTESTKEAITKMKVTHSTHSRSKHTATHTMPQSSLIGTGIK